MTISELIQSGIIKDSDNIQISRPVAGRANVVRRGNWYNDNILDWMDVPIYLIKWTRDNGWVIQLEREVVQ